MTVQDEVEPLREKDTDYQGEGLRTSEFLLFYDIAFLRFKELLEYSMKQREAAENTEKQNNNKRIMMTSAEVIIFATMALESCANCIIRDHGKSEELRRSEDLKNKSTLYKKWHFIIHQIIGEIQIGDTFLQILDMVVKKRHKMTHAIPQKIEVLTNQSRMMFISSNKNGPTIQLAVNAIHAYHLLEEICNKLPVRAY